MGVRLKMSPTDLSKSNYRKTTVYDTMLIKLVEYKISGLYLKQSSTVWNKDNERLRGSVYL